MFSTEFKTFLPQSVGFDNLFEEVTTMARRANNYPPHNVVKRGEVYYLEMALAGWSPEDVSVKVVQNKLVISGTSSDEREGESYVHKGISTRSFTRSFLLRDLSVANASFENGLLVVTLESELTPEREIDIMVNNSKRFFTE